MGSKTSYLEVQNHGYQDIRDIEVREYDRYDWAEGSGPQNNFQGQRIKKGSSLRYREELTRGANKCPFTMDLIGENGEKDTFRIHQLYAYGCCASFQHLHGISKLSYSRTKDHLVIIKTETSDKQLDNMAQTIDMEGEILKLQGRFEEAVDRYDKALPKARFPSTKALIRIHKAEIIYRVAIKAEEDGWKLEAANKSDEATKKFALAEKRFRECPDRIYGHNKNSDIQRVKNKMEGNKYYNEASELEKQAYWKVYGNSFIGGQAKYEEAQRRYKLAVRCFEKERDARFKECAKFTSEQIGEVDKLYLQIHKAKLAYDIQNLRVADKKPVCEET